jgi:repressor LexA
LKLTKRSQDLLSSLKDHNNRPDQTASGGIPLAGTVAAGLPIEAIENHDTISLKDHFAATDDVFALRIQGDSMKDANICHGDLVICRRAETASNGWIVVALIDDNEATVKTFYKEKNTIRLQPANDAYEPIFTRNCRIIAVVLGLLRKF